jgi:site-specific recombinase XerD
LVVVMGVPETFLRRRSVNIVREKIKLGNVGKKSVASAPSMSRAELLRRVEDHVVHELHYTEKNRRATMQGVRYLVDHYGVGGRPLSNAEGARIREAELDRELSARTVNMRLFYYELIAEALGHNDDGQPIHVKKLRKTRPVNDYFTVEERDTMIAHAANLRDLAVLWVGFSCGPRPDELCHIHLDDIELSKRCVVIRDHGQGIKTYQERRSPMNDAAIKAVRGWLDVRPVVPSKALFLNKYGQPLNMQRLREIVLTTARASGITRRAYPYMLRHSCATHLLQSGGSVADVALQLGDTMETVVRYYVHQDMRSLETAVRRL